MFTASLRRSLLLLALLCLVTSCESTPKRIDAPPPPLIDCAEHDVPDPLPTPPDPALRNGTPEFADAWAKYGFAWANWATGVLTQRFHTADCLERARDKGVIR
jgi:hypothetical protein